MRSSRRDRYTDQIQQSKEFNLRLARDILLGAILVFTIILPLIQQFNAEASEDQALSGSDRQTGSGAPDAADYATKGKGEDEWYLILINSDNAVPSDYSIELETLQDGSQVDQRCATELQQMLDDCRAAGNEPLICSSYRTQETQEHLFQEKMDQLIEEGYATEDAYQEADRNVAVPGTSEHQIGLAVDIVDAWDQELEDTQAQTPTQQWLMNNSWRYGFILRYAADKTDITGKIYEPWHYRYVGEQDAKEIYEQGISLEEYV